MPHCPFCNGDTQYDQRMYRGHTVTFEYCPFCDRTMNPAAVPGSKLKDADAQVAAAERGDTISERPFKETADAEG